MEESLINIVERVGSLGLLGWLLVWATGTAWPKVSAHLDTVSAKLDKIAEQLTGLREDITELRHSVGADLVSARSGENSKPGSSSTAGGRKALPYAKGKLSTSGSKA